MMVLVSAVQLVPHDSPPCCLFLCEYSWRGLHAGTVRGPSERGSQCRGRQARRQNNKKVEKTAARHTKKTGRAHLATPCVQYVAAAEAAAGVWQDPCGLVKDVPGNLAEGDSRMAAATAAVALALPALQHGGIATYGFGCGRGSSGVFGGRGALGASWWCMPLHDLWFTDLGTQQVPQACQACTQPQPASIAGVLLCLVCVCRRRGGGGGEWGWQAHSDAPFSQLHQQPVVSPTPQACA
jgi:hypothetical protein